MDHFKLEGIIKKTLEIKIKIKATNIIGRNINQIMKIYQMKRSYF